eukprot:TRINITY_DN848_c0_g1_i1.p1 TRINITY_DN848_c0_g1~~TRINITY_DN848_c0_g1_i1.p1  ORF type:complete len:318 (+),score=67.51 TRINITY_DN848_c0_g1_i1:155-1108(+)
MLAGVKRPAVSLPDRNGGSSTALYASEQGPRHLPSPSPGSGAPGATDAGSTIFSLHARDVVCCDEGGRGELRRIRVVCMSDTHGKHWEMRDKIPDGDLFIHAGDFSFKMRAPHAESVLQDFNAWLGSLPHRHKVVTAGNHEIALNDYTPQQIQDRLSNCIYLQDSGAVVAGLAIYGTPWTSSCNMGFSDTHAGLERRVWPRIPRGLDILITHMPPWNLRDLAYDPRAVDPAPCKVCAQVHRRHAHWGSKGLRQRVEAVRPRVHIFGHVHNSHGCADTGDTLFVNAAQDLLCQPIFFDCIVRQGDRAAYSRGTVGQPF